MTHSIRSILAVGALAAALLAPSAVSAATVTECEQQLASLRTQVDASTFSGRNAAKEEAGLLGKLQAASDALAAGKYTNSVTKLGDFIEHTSTIAAAGKLDATQAAALVAGANDAIVCVSSIGAPAA